jgi:hypothetical protein
LFSAKQEVLLHLLTELERILLNSKAPLNGWDILSIIAGTIIFTILMIALFGVVGAVIAVVADVSVLTWITVTGLDSK